MPETSPYTSVVLEGLSFVDGLENTSGIQEDAYLIPFDYIKTLQVPTPGTTPESLIEITTAHVLATGKSIIPLYTMFEKSELESQLMGETYSHVWMTQAKFFMPQPGEQNSINLSILKNRRFIVLVKRMGSNNFVQIGTAGMYAKLKAGGKLSFGQGPTGSPGIEFQIEAPGVHPFFVYTASLPVTGT